MILKIFMKRSDVANRLIIKNYFYANLSKTPHDNRCIEEKFCVFIYGL